MSSQPGPARPPQATVAGWLVVAGSVLVVLLALDQGAGLHSLETRDAVTDYLSGSGERLGLSVQDALMVLRITTSVAAASAAATAVLGWYALQRSKGARLGLSWLAAPLFVSGFFSTGPAGAVPAMVCAAIVMLWFQPARDWFDGVTPVPPPRPLTPQVPQAPQAPLERDPLLDLPPPTTPPLHPASYPAPYPVRPGAPAPARTPSTHRPASVTWACVLAWLSTAAVFGVLAVALVVTLAAPDAVFDELHKQNPDLAGQGWTDAELRATTYLACALVMAWSAGAAALALLAWRRVRWAALTLAGSAGLASLLCVLSLIGALVVMVVPLAACAATAALLLRPESLAWFRGRPA